MTPEERALLESTHQLAKDNNELLRSIKRRSSINTTVKVLYWVVILGISFGAFYFIQPYVEMIKSLGGTSTPSQDSSYVQQLQSLLQ